MSTMHLRSLCACWCLAALAACTTTPPIRPIPVGAPVTIVVTAGRQTDGAVEIRNQAVGHGMSAGAGSGAVVGGLWGLACGPFAPLCIPVLAAAGAITGTAAGAAVGVTGALPDDKAAQLRERWGRLRQSHDVLEELRRNVTERAGRHWTVVSDTSGSVLTLELQRMDLTSTRDERIGLWMQVLVTVRATGVAAGNAPLQKTYDYESPLSSLSAWLDERGDLLDTTLTSATQQLAAQIVAEVAAK